MLLTSMDISDPSVICLWGGGGGGADGTRLIKRSLIVRSVQFLLNNIRIKSVH